jgi:hypothetical protein
MPLAAGLGDGSGVPKGKPAEPFPVQPGGAVVIADIRGDRDAVNTWAGADGGETGHSDNTKSWKGLVKVSINCL